MFNYETKPEHPLPSASAWIIRLTKRSQGGWCERTRSRGGREKKREIMQEEKEKPSQKSQGSRAAQTNRWLHKQTANCVVKHQCRKPQLWAAADVMGSTAFIPSVFLHQGACLIKQEGLPFSDPGPPTAVHRNAHLNSNGGELHRPPESPLLLPQTFKIYSAADK